MVSAYWPERVEGITGVPHSDVVRAARMIGTAGSAMVLTARGAEQQAQGVNNVLTYINIALATGRVGRPNNGYGCVTCQGNGQGAREHGQKADQLPGYRMITDPEARRHVAGVWGVEDADLPGPGKYAYELLSELGAYEGVQALLVSGSNVAVSTPNASLIEERLRSLDFLVVSDFFLSETADLADVVLPSAQWAEEEGTMTNLEGRVILRRRAIESPEGVRTDSEVICELARRLGRGHYFDYQDTRAVFDELRRASAGGSADYSGITYERITAENGVFWPCPSEAEPGMQRLFTDGRFPTASGRAQFHAVSHQSPAEETDAEYPMCLTTGRVLAQYQSGTQTRRVAKLDVAALIVFSVLVQMTEGATYSVVPFINRRAVGSVAGIVGAGGNAGAVMAGFLFRAEGLDTHTAFLSLGVAVLAISPFVLLVRFSQRGEEEQRVALKTPARTLPCPCAGQLRDSPGTEEVGSGWSAQISSLSGEGLSQPGLPQLAPLPCSPLCRIWSQRRP